MNCHDTIDRMDLVLDGALPPAERPGFDEHLDECGPCRNYFRQLTVTIRALGRLPREAGSNPRRAELLERFRRGLRDS